MSVMSISNKDQIRSLYSLSIDIMIGADEALKDAVINMAPEEEIKSRREEYSRAVERFKQFEEMMISMEASDVK